MIYKYIFCKAYKGYLYFEGESGVPIFSAIMVVSTIQSMSILSLFLFTKELMHWQVELSKIQIFIPAISIMLIDYIWLCKINKLNDLLDQINTLPKSRSNALGIATAIHIALCIGLFITAIELKS